MIRFKQTKMAVILILGILFSGISQASLTSSYTGPDISLSDFLISAPDRVAANLASTNITSGVVDSNSDRWYQRNIATNVSVFGRQIGGSINEFWIKYNLDPSSTSTGALWVSFGANTVYTNQLFQYPQTYDINNSIGIWFDKVSSSPLSNSFVSLTGDTYFQDKIYINGMFSMIYPTHPIIVGDVAFNGCLSCVGSESLNLSFIQFIKNGNVYTPFTRSTGESVILSRDVGCMTCGYSSSSLNIAPVPIPSAIWLFGTAMAGFIGSFFGANGFIA